MGRKQTTTRFICLAIPIAAACGYSATGPNQPDPYNGFVDGIGLDSKFQPTPKTTNVCPSGFCYPAQYGYSNGKKVYFYNLGSTETAFLATNQYDQREVLINSNLTPIPSAYVFQTGACNPTSAEYDPFIQTFRPDLQYPVFSGLPLINDGFGTTVVPFVTTYGVGDNSGTGCNYLKDARSIGTANAPGKFNSSAGPPLPAPGPYMMWPVINVTTYTSSSLSSPKSVNGYTCVFPDCTTRACPVQPLPSLCYLPSGANACKAATTTNICNASASSQCASNYGTCTTNCQNATEATVCLVSCQDDYLSCTTLQQYGWFEGLQFAYLNGGPVPENPQDSSSLAYMDGVLLDPAGTFSKTTTAGAIILPAIPGEPGYSPMVRVHDFTMPAGAALGTYTSLCPTGINCAPNEVDMTQVQYPAFNTMFIVTVAQ
jgi:hypothetical protein